MMIYALTFDANSPIIFIIVGCIIALVLGQSTYFLIKAVKRAKEMGMDFSKVKKTIISSAIFTIAPAIAILVGVISLSKCLGIAVPWLRLSVVGSLSYETIAAGTATGALGITLADRITDASYFVTVVFIMTSGIMIGLLLVPIFTKKIQAGVLKVGQKDKRWGEIFNDALFLGMISAFVGYVFSDIYYLWDKDALNNAIANGKLEVGTKSTVGLIAVFVMIISAVVIVLLALLAKKTKKRWITDYALPISLLCGMAAAIPLTIWLG